MNRSLAVVLGLALATAGWPAAISSTAISSSAMAQSPFPPAPGAAAASPFPPAPGPAPASPFPPAPGAAPASPFPPPSQSSQFPAPSQTSQFPQGPQGPPAMRPQAPQCVEFPRLRDEAQKKAGTVEAIGKRKGDRKEMCAAVTNFFNAEAAVVKFLDTNKTSCGVPEQALAQAKMIHTNTLKFRDQVCAEGPKPKAPTLSDAIATPSLDTEKNTSTKRGGTFDTLTGNPLAR